MEKADKGAHATFDLWGKTGWKNINQVKIVPEETLIILMRYRCVREH